MVAGQYIPIRIEYFQVSDVAARCGFTSATYFSQAFRQHFGQRAGEVARAARAAATARVTAGPGPEGRPRSARN